MALLHFETKDGTTGFIQEEGIFDTKWVIYKNKFIGSEKIGSVEPKEDELRKFLEKQYGKPVTIW